MITSNLTGVVCGNSDVLLDQLIDEGVHFDLILTDPPSSSVNWKIKNIFAATFGKMKICY